ncbi:hypothetical protein INR49_028357 [Caranx melampygus]|nr:hypothetical protein INR49_028357 [Caranx melampygus]
MVFFWLHCVSEFKASSHMITSHPLCCYLHPADELITGRPLSSGGARTLPDLSLTPVTSPALMTQQQSSPTQQPGRP